MTKHWFLAGSSVEVHFDFAWTWCKAQAMPCDRFDAPVDMDVRRAVGPRDRDRVVDALQREFRIKADYSSQPGR